MTQEKKDAVQAERELRFAIACGDFTTAGQKREEKTPAEETQAETKVV